MALIKLIIEYRKRKQFERFLEVTKARMWAHKEGNVTRL